MLTEGRRSPFCPCPSSGQQHRRRTSLFFSADTGSHAARPAPPFFKADPSLPFLAAFASHSQILSRGERIELLVDKTDNLSGQAFAFRRGAKQVRRRMWWKNQRILALSSFVGVVRLSFLSSSFFATHPSLPFAHHVLFSSALAFIKPVVAGSCAV